jgi:tetratricopeptide (TPR) repeat protein
MVDRKAKLNLAISGAAVAIGFFTANPVLATVAQGIGLNWAATQTWPLWERIRDHWLTPAGLLHNDLATAFGRALQLTLDPPRLAADFRQSEAYRKLSPPQKQECDGALEILKGDLAPFFGNTSLALEQAGGSPGFDARTLLQGDPHQAQKVLHARLADYLHGHQNSLIAFVRQRLDLERLQYHFSEELLRNERALDAYRHLLLTGLQEELQDAATQAQADTDALRQMIGRLEERTLARDDLHRALRQLAAYLRQEIAAEHQATRQHSTEEHDTTRRLIEQVLAQLPRVARPVVKPNEAQALLAQMPLDHVPPVSPTMPPGSRMPLLPNPHFTGREEELKELARLLRGGETVAIGQSTAVTGAGGIGKSQLAVEFAHRYGPYFAGGVFLLNMSEPANVPAEVAACGGPAGMDLLPGFGDLPLDEQAQRVLQVWRSDGLPRLIIFDNCEEPELLAQWRPGGACRILVTARRGQWPGSLGLTPLPLPTLPRAESVALLQNHAPTADAGVLEQIAAELGDLPLALSLAGGFMETYADMPFTVPEKVLARLRQPDLLASAALTGHGQEHSPTGHDRHVARTFALSLERLDESAAVDRLALDLLARAACFAPGEPIPAELLLATAPGSDDAASEAMAALCQADALKRLADVGLLEAGNGDGDERRLHRLVAAFVRQELAALLHEARAAVEHIVLAEANRLNKVGYPQALLPWQPHLRHVADVACERAGEGAAELCNTFAYHLQSVGDLAGARVYYERALEIRDRVLGSDHPETIATVNCLGLLLKDLGDLAGARLYFEQALTIHQRTVAPDYDGMAASLNNLGLLLKDMGDRAGARFYLEQALAVRKEALRSQHPDRAIDLNNLGWLLKDMDDLAGARTYFERALTIREEILGLKHPETAIDLNNLGWLLKDMGDLAGARPYFERALAIRQEILGPTHPETAIDRNNLGLLLKDMGDLAGARPYFEQALAIVEHVLGPDHPNTVTSLNNLGWLFKDMGDLAGARRYFEGALAVHKKALGLDHPHTATSLNNLGHLLDSTGDLAGARPYYERALAIREKALGPDHPHTAQSLNNLGALLQGMGDLVAARPYFERAVTILEAKLGPEHPTTQIVRRNLANLLEE